MKTLSGTTFGGSFLAAARARRDRRRDRVAENAARRRSHLHVHERNASAPSAAARRPRRRPTAAAAAGAAGHDPQARFADDPRPPARRAGATSRDQPAGHGHAGPVPGGRHAAGVRERRAPPPPAPPALLLARGSRHARRRPARSPWSCTLTARGRARLRSAHSLHAVLITTLHSTSGAKLSPRGAARSRSTTRPGSSLARGLGLALSAALWLLPPAGAAGALAQRARRAAAPARRRAAARDGAAPRTGPALVRGAGPGAARRPVPAGRPRARDLRRRPAARGRPARARGGARAACARRVRASCASPSTGARWSRRTRPRASTRATRRAPTTASRALDASVRSAVAAGFEPLLVVSHAPALRGGAGTLAATPTRAAGRRARPRSKPSPPRSPAATTAASPTRRSPARALPRVRLFQAWNEPNLARYLEPQWVAREGRWSAFSPLLYRQLLNGVLRRA